MTYFHKVLTPIGSFIEWLADLVITDEYLERRQREWKEAKTKEIYLS